MLKKFENMPLGTRLFSRVTYKALLGGVILFNVLILVMGGISIYHSKLHIQEMLNTSTADLARVIEKSLGGYIDAIDSALLAVQQEVTKEIASGGIDAARLSGFLLDQQRYHNVAFVLRVLNAQGVVMYGEGVPVGGGPDSSQHDFFIQARNDELKDSLIISKPLLLQTDHQWAIVIARRLSNPDGSFAGVVCATMRLEYLGGLLSEIDIGRGGAIAVHDIDANLLIRYPEPARPESMTGAKSSQELQKMLADQPISGTYVIPSVKDGIEQTFSYRKVAGKPLYIFVGQSSEEHLLRWYQESGVVLALMGLFVLASVGLTLLVRHLQKGQGEAPMALFQQQQVTQSYLNTTFAMMVALDTQGKITMVNRAACTLLGYTEEQLLGANWFEKCLPQPDGIALVYPVFLKLMAGEMDGVEFFENEVVCSDNKRRLIAWHNATLHDKEGAIIGILGSGHDITERKRMEDRLIMLNDELQELNTSLSEQVELEVSARIEALRELQTQEAMLIQSSKMADMGEMIGAIAHQWKQPINTVYVLVQSLMDQENIDGLTKEDLKKGLDGILAQAEFMNQTIEDFRTYFIPSADKGVFRAGDAVDRVITLLGQQFRVETIDVTLKREGDFLVNGSLNELCQVLLNLFKNAIDAMKERTIMNRSIQISLTQDGVNGVISVRDSAGGITPEALSCMFEPFFSTKGEKGTGIGLSLSRKIIREHFGGSIAAENVGSGAEFVITLPLSA